MSRWISVEDRLPEITGTSTSSPVLVRRDCGDNTLCSYFVTFMWDKTREDIAGEKWKDCETIGYRVTHWMPLPPPPEASHGR